MDQEPSTHSACSDLFHRLKLPVALISMASLLPACVSGLRERPFQDLAEAEPTHTWVDPNASHQPEGDPDDLSGFDFPEFPGRGEELTAEMPDLEREVGNPVEDEVQIPCSPPIVEPEPTSVVEQSEPVPDSEPQAVEAQPGAECEVCNSGGSSIGAEKMSWGELANALFVGIGALTVLRGAIKGVFESTLVYRALYGSFKNFQDRVWFNEISMNVLKLEEQGDALLLKVGTFQPLPVGEVFSGRFQRKRFLKAARRCTHKQQFIHREYPRDKNRTTIDGLNRMNKPVRERFAAIYQDGLRAYAMDLPVHMDRFVVVPICEVAPPDAKPSKALKFFAISMRHFERFGNPEDVERMIASHSSKRLQNIIRLVRDMHQEFYEYRDLHGPNEQLFPVVPVYEKLMSEPDQKKELRNVA